MASSSTDKSTTWSNYEWDGTRKQWYTSRRNARGETEYYYYPQESETTSAAQDDSSTPRTFADAELEVSQNPPLQSYNLPPAAATTTGSAYDQYATANYKIAPAGGTPYVVTAPSYTTAPESYTASDPYDATVASSYPLLTSVGHGSATGSSSPELTTSTGYYPVSTCSNYQSPSYGTNDPQGYGSSDYENAEGIAGGLHSAMEALSFASQGTTQEQGQPQVAGTEQWPPNMKTIYKAPGTSNYEELDTRYQTIPDKNQKRFWRVGRVFMMLWTEPAKVTKVGPGGGTRNGSHFSTTWLNEKAYTEIRRFVVVRAGYGNCICSPIQTYSGQGTLKPNLPEREQHAIIYTSNEPPPELFYTATDGTVVQENLSKDPIRVISEQQEKEGQLEASSRLNYSKIYTVEHYVRVLNIGLVAMDSIQSLEANSYVRPPTAPPGRPSNHPPPAHREKRSSNSKHKGKGKGKSSEHGGERRRH